MKMINISIKTANKAKFFKFSNLIYSDINIFHIHTFYPRRLVWCMASRGCYGVKRKILVVNNSSGEFVVIRCV